MQAFSPQHNTNCAYWWTSQWEAAYSIIWYALAELHLKHQHQRLFKASVSLAWGFEEHCKQWGQHAGAESQTRHRDYSQSALSVCHQKCCEWPLRVLKLLDEIGWFPPRCFGYWQFPEGLHDGSEQQRRSLCYLPLILHRLADKKWLFNTKNRQIWSTHKHARSKVTDALGLLYSLKLNLKPDRWHSNVCSKKTIKIAWQLTSRHCILSICINFTSFFSKMFFSR